MEYSTKEMPDDDAEYKAGISCCCCMTVPSGLGCLYFCNLCNLAGGITKN